MNQDKIRQALDVLRDHNAWRRGETNFAQYPKRVGEAIDVACEVLAKQPAPSSDPVDCPYLKDRSGTKVCILSGETPPASSAPDDASRQSAFEAWCPYKGSPDPYIVWNAAWAACCAAMLAAAPEAPTP